MMAILSYGSDVEVDADADEAVLAGVDAGGADDAGAVVAGLLGEADVEVVGVGATDVGEAEDGDGVGEANERRLGDVDADVDALADEDTLPEADEEADAEADPRTRIRAGAYSAPGPFRRGPWRLLP